MSEYEMKKSLRRGANAPKSYAEPQEDMVVIPIPPPVVEKKEKQLPRESIFEHKNWTVKQKIKLMVFLSFYQVLSDWHSQRKSIYLYKHLSNFLKRTRTPQQCKNIHSLLKRKFSTIDQIVQQMQPQLQMQQNYQKLLLKYQKDINNFQKQHKLFDNVYEQQKYEPISSRRITQREQQRTQRQIKYNNQSNRSSFQAQKRMQELNLEGPMVKCQEQNPQFASKRDNILQRCNFYFKEWLLLSSVLEHRVLKEKEGEAE